MISKKNIIYNYRKLIIKGINESIVKGEIWAINRLKFIDLIDKYQECIPLATMKYTGIQDIFTHLYAGDDSYAMSDFVGYIKLSKKIKLTKEEYELIKYFREDIGDEETNNLTLFKMSEITIFDE